MKIINIIFLKLELEEKFLTKAYRPNASFIKREIFCYDSIVYMKQT